MRRLGVLIAVLWLSGCRATLYHELSEAEANAALLALSDAGIAATKTRGRGGLYELTVSSFDESAAVRALTVAHLPRATSPLPEEDALFPSPKEASERERARAALSIAQSLEVVEGVLEARVELAPPLP